MSDRAEFEKSISGRFPGMNLSFDATGEYADLDACQHWETWQAARAQGGEAVAAAKAEVERLRGRVAELRELVTLFGKLPFNCHDYMTEEQWEKICWIHAEIDGDTSRSWLLRRQADAIEFAVSEARTHLIECAWPQSGLPDEASITLDEVDGHAGRLRDEARARPEHAQRLHRQADEIEKAGVSDV